MYCPGCGSNNQDEVKFCTRCGTNLDIVSEALRGRTTGGLEPNERIVNLLKDYYRSRRMTIIGTIASLIGLFKLAVLLMLGFPEKLVPLAALLAGLLMFGLFALIWGMTKWNNSSSELKALGITPVKRGALPAVPGRLRLDYSSTPSADYVTDPIKTPGSVTEQTTHLLDDASTMRPPMQKQ